VYWPRGGDGKPRLKQFESEGGGLVPFTLWTSAEVGENSDANAEIRALFPAQPPFSTPKPERLLERVIHIGSNPGDIVLDCFAGSGTTAAVAHKMGRRWVTTELSDTNIETFVLPRLSRVVDGTDDGGVTARNDWKGGAGFELAAVGPSMFEDADGTTVLADWATGGALAEAVAAQLHYRYEPEGPYAGRKGRSRLAVLDGMLTRGVADHLLAGLDDKEALVVVAQALEPEVEDYVRVTRLGCRARKVPRDLAGIGRKASRLVRLAAPTEAADG
jgi:adenine-specific DNA-methyltransferase